MRWATMSAYNCCLVFDFDLFGESLFSGVSQGYIFILDLHGTMWRIQFPSLWWEDNSYMNDNLYVCLGLDNFPLNF